MRSRGHNPRWLGHAKPYATSAGAIFVRSYERGERVYLAMASRGYDGHMPRSPGESAAAAEWVAVLVIPVFAWLVAIAAWWLL